MLLHEIEVDVSIQNIKGYLQEYFFVKSEELPVFINQSMSNIFATHCWYLNAKLECAVVLSINNY